MAADVRRTIFLSALGVALLAKLPAAQAQGPQIECDATYRAWSIDPQMKDYLKTHTCVCDERSNSLKCTATGGGGSSGARSQGGGRAPAHHKTTNGDIMRAALKGALADYAADSARTSAAVAAQSKANQALVKEQNELKSAMLLDDEAKKLAALQSEAAARKQAAQQLAGQLASLPPSAGLTIGDALQSDAARKLELATKLESCRSAAETVARLEGSLPKLEADMAKNRRLIDDAEQGIKAAAADAVKETGSFFYNKKYDELEDRLKDFVKTKKQLQLMKRELDALEKGVGLRQKGRKLTPAQIKAAREWIDNGVKYSDDLVDAVKMSYKYNTDGGPKNKEQAEGYGRKALAALDDFNSRFMNDAGGWEFAGEHLAEAGFGPAGKLLFKQAVLGIKLSVDAGSAIIDANSIRGYKEQQEILELERSKRLERISELKQELAAPRCAATGDSLAKSRR